MAAVFCKAKKNYIDQEEGKKLFEMDQITVLFHSDEFISFGLSKMETGAKIAPQCKNMVTWTGRCQNLFPV